MKILVIYYSQTGRTKRVAKELTDILRSRGAEVIHSLGIDSTRLFNDKVKDSIRDFAKKLC